MGFGVGINKPSGQLDDQHPPVPESDAGSRGHTTRRSFLKRVGLKVAYVTPLVLSLAAREARAGGSAFNSTCRDVGSPCTIILDPCCTGLLCLEAGMSGNFMCQ